MSECKRSRKQSLAVIAGWIISLMILLVMGMRLEWDGLIHELGRIQWRYSPLLIFLTLATFWVRAIRWRHLLPNGTGVSRSSLFQATLVGFTATFLLPLRVGEIIRPWVLSQWQPVKFSAGVASVVTERAFDAITLMVMLGIALSRIESVPPLVSVGARIVSVLAVSILLMLVVVYLGSGHLTKMGERMTFALLGKRWPMLAKRMVSMIEGFLSGLRGISNLKELGWAILWSLVLWSLLAVLYQVGLWCFGVEASPWVGVTVCVMIALAVAVPGAPGFVGTFQLGCVVALSIFGYPEEFSIAYSLVLHALQVVTVVAAGFTILHHRGLQFSDIRKESLTDH